MITKGEEIQILIYRSLDPYLFLSQPYTILAQILIYRSSNMHLFLSNSILPFTQTLSFFVLTLFYHLFNSHFILSGSYSTVRSNPIFFCHNSILPFTQTLSFFCHNSILPFVPLPLFSVSILFIEPLSFFVLNLILFYHSLKPHLFLSFYSTVCTIYTFLSSSYSTVN